MACIYSFLLFAVLALGCHSQVTLVLLGNSSDVCVDQRVALQCEVDVPNGTNNALTLTILDANGEKVGSQISFTTFNPDYREDTNGGFFFQLESSQPRLISNISFTVQSSINGYTICCEDGNTLLNENFTIVVPDNSPGDVIIPTDTFTNSSVNISWTGSPSYCNTNYTYNVSSSALEENIIMNSTSNSVMVKGLVPSYDQYCVMVTAKDQYSTRESNKSYFILKVPSIVTNLTLTSMDENCITASWNVPLLTDIDGIFVPELLAYYVTIMSDGLSTDPPKSLPPANTTVTFCDIESGQEYVVQVTAINGVGSSEASSATIYIEEAQVTSPGTYTTVSTSDLPNGPMSMNNESAYTTSGDSSLLNSSIQPTPSVSDFTSVNTTPTTGSNDGELSGGAIVGIIIAVVVVVVAVAVVVVSIYCCYKKPRLGDQSTRRPNNDLR